MLFLAFGRMLRHVISETDGTKRDKGEINSFKECPPLVTFAYTRQEKNHSGNHEKYTRHSFKVDFPRFSFEDFCIHQFPEVRRSLRDSLTNRLQHQASDRNSEYGVKDTENSSPDSCWSHFPVTWEKVKK